MDTFEIVALGCEMGGEQMLDPGMAFGIGARGFQKAEVEVLMWCL